MTINNNLITVRDLRIGNYIKIYGDKFHFQEVLQINRGSIGIEDDEFECVEINEVNPIPITEKWLTSLGFKFVIRNMYMLRLNNEIQLQFYENQDEFIVIAIGQYDSALIHTDLKKIKYIHQLQNLYFALTGEELKTS